MSLGGRMFAATNARASSASCSSTTAFPLRLSERRRSSDRPRSHCVAHNTSRLVRLRPPRYGTSFGAFSLPRCPVTRNCLSCTTWWRQDGWSIPGGRQAIERRWIPLVGSKCTWFGSTMRALDRPLSWWVRRPSCSLELGESPDVVGADSAASSDDANAPVDPTLCHRSMGGRRHCVVVDPVAVDVVAAVGVHADRSRPPFEGHIEAGVDQIDRGVHDRGRRRCRTRRVRRLRRTEIRRRGVGRSRRRRWERPPTSHR